MNIAVSVAEQQFVSQAQQLAQTLALPFIQYDQIPHYDAILLHTLAGLKLTWPKQKQNLHIDFLRGKNNHRRFFSGGYKQLIARACAVKKNAPPTILDATAGLGSDAFALACLGCHIHLIERSPLIAALLSDALSRLRTNTTLYKGISLHLTPGNACHIMQAIDSEKKPDIVYLDPMHPIQRRSALAKKEMRLLRGIVGSDDDANNLFIHALECAQKRIVVKRPRFAAPLNEHKPDLVYSGQSSRFDVYLISVRAK
ncbi:MAG: class I SAM-dependent methyltransferase [Gammaproteobacteria bacterium]